VKTGRIALLMLALLLAGPAFGAEIEALTAECDSCHGPLGVSSHDQIPIIAGQTSEFLQKTLRSYQRWDRPCVKTTYPNDTSRPKTDMCKITEAFGAEELQALGAWYSTQVFVAANQEFDEALAASGAALHAQHCEKCHQEGGRLAEGNEPRLAGQWLPYLRKSINYVPTGEHMVPPMMERAVSKFSVQEVNALMNFYASQQD